MEHLELINCLPDDMLEEIIEKLAHEERKPAALVCKRWAELRLYASVTVQLVIDKLGFADDYHQTLLASSRRYKNLRIDPFVFQCHGKDQLFEDIIRHFSESVKSVTLRLRPGQSTSSEYLVKVSQLLLNLKNLDVIGGHFDHQDHLLLHPMVKLEKLFVQNNMLLYVIPNMHLYTPNITKLDVIINSAGALAYLGHMSAQLVELKARIRSHTNLLAVGRMSFPLVRKADIMIYGRMMNEQQVAGEAEAISLLRPALPNVVSLQFAHLNTFVPAYFTEDSWRAVCNLKHLKDLKLTGSIMSAPGAMNFPPLNSLHKLTLQYIKLLKPTINAFFRHAFPNLAVLELRNMQLSRVLRRNLVFEKYRKIYSDIPSLKRLVLFEPLLDVHLDKFVKFCASQAPRELRITCNRVLYEQPLEKLKKRVETLTLQVTCFSGESLIRLIGAMEEQLKRLELGFHRPELKLPLSVFQCVQFLLPQCEVVDMPQDRLEKPPELNFNQHQ